MELTANTFFLTWARQHGIGLDPEHPEILGFLPRAADNRLWPVPLDSRERLAMLTIALDALDPWQGCWAYKREAGWSFAREDDAGFSERGLDVVTRWIGIPENYNGSIWFDEQDRAKLVLLLMVFNEYSWNTEYDVFFVPDHGRQILWLDHENVLWVFFSNTDQVASFVARMETAGFSLPTEPPQSIAWQPWMRPNAGG